MRSFGGAVGYPMYPTRTALPGVFSPNDHWQMVQEDRAPTPQDPQFSNTLFIIHGNAVINERLPKFTVGGSGILTSTINFSGANMSIRNTNPIFPTTSFFVTSGGTGTGITCSFTSTAIGTRDFTIEIWFRPSNIGTGPQALIDLRPSGLNGAYSTISLQSGGAITYFENSTTRITSSVNLVVGTAYHIAYTRSGGNLGTLWINGASAGTWADTASYSSISEARCGCSSFSGVSGPETNSYFDEFRVTVGAQGSGAARYTSNFTPPTSRFPDY